MVKRWIWGIEMRHHHATEVLSPFGSGYVAEAHGSGERTGSLRTFGRRVLIASALAAFLALEVGWVALLGYGLVFLFS
jgi:hypothetical protein